MASSTLWFNLIIETSALKLAKLLSTCWIPNLTAVDFSLKIDHYAIYKRLFTAPNTARTAIGDEGKGIKSNIPFYKEGSGR